MANQIEMLLHGTSPVVTDAASPGYTRSRRSPRRSPAAKPDLSSPAGERPDPGDVIVGHHYQHGSIDKRPSRVHMREKIQTFDRKPCRLVVPSMSSRR